MACFTDDARWVTGRTVVEGRVDLAEFFADAFDGLLATLEIEDLLVVDDRVAVQLAETVLMEATGEKLRFSIAGFYRLRGGLIASAKIYREGSAELSEARATAVVVTDS